MDKYLAHILVVDDDDRIRELVKQYLLENKYLADVDNVVEVIPDQRPEYTNKMNGFAPGPKHCKSWKG